MLCQKWGVIQYQLYCDKLGAETKSYIIKLNNAGPKQINPMVPKTYLYISGMYMHVGRTSLCLLLSSQWGCSWLIILILSISVQVIMPANEL